MNRKAITLFAAGMLLLGTAAGCSTSGSKEDSKPSYSSETGAKESNMPGPALTVSAPAEGSTVTGDSVTVKVEVKNYDLVDFQSNPTPKTGQGHVHIWLDTDANDPKAAYKLVSGNSASFDKVAAGDHTLTVQLVGNDHKPIEPAVKQVIHFKTVSGTMDYSSKPSGTETKPSAPPAAGKTYSMELSGYAFSQQSLTIEAGSTVTFTNRDEVGHTVTAKDGTFDSGLLSTGKSYTATFSKPGTYVVYCKPHPKMTATIIVK
jgi:plastocyanin